MYSNASAPSGIWTSLLARFLFLSARMVNSASCSLSSTSRISHSVSALMTSFPLGDQSTENEHCATTAIADGHTTSGKREISDQVGAIPLENRDCRNPKVRRSGDVINVRRMGRQSRQQSS